MILNLGLPVLLAIILAAIHFTGEELEEYTQGYHERIVSLAAGISITYIFAILLPEYQNMMSGSRFLFVTPLLGFSSIHLMEKVIAKKDLNERKLRRDFSEIHSAFLLIYHGAIGFLLASLIASNRTGGLLFFLPILFHSAVSSFSFGEIHEDFSKRLGVKLTVSLAPIAGVMLHATGQISEFLFDPIFGVVTGMFIYVVIRDSIPEGRDGKPVEYVIGVFLYLVIIALVRFHF